MNFADTAEALHEVDRSAGRTSNVLLGLLLTLFALALSTTWIAAGTISRLTIVESAIVELKDSTPSMDAFDALKERVDKMEP